MPLPRSACRVARGTPPGRPWGRPKAEVTGLGLRPREDPERRAHEGSVLRHIRGLSGEHARRAPCTAQQVQKAGQRRLLRKGEEAREDRHRSETLCDSA